MNQRDRLTDIEITPEMVSAGVDALSFWLDGLLLAESGTSMSQAVIAAYSAMVEKIEKPR